MKINNKDILFVAYGKLIFSKVTYGSKILWAAINSCFGSGKWFSNLKWSSTDRWKN